AAEGAIVHRLVTVVGVITQLPAVQLQQPLLHRTTGNAVLTDGGEHLRKDADDFDTHGPGFRSPCPSPPASRRRPGRPAARTARYRAVGVRGHPGCPDRA